MRKAPETRSLASRAQPTEFWIPACAGMTEIGAGEYLLPVPEACPHSTCTILPEEGAGIRPCQGPGGVPQSPSPLVLTQEWGAKEVESKSLESVWDRSTLSHSGRA